MLIQARLKEAEEPERLALERETTRRKEAAAAHERKMERLRLALHIVMAKHAG